MVFHETACALDPLREAFMDERDVQIIDDVKRLATPLVEAEGITLVDVLYQREPAGRILRLIVDKAGGVTLEECARISTELADLLDVKSQIGEPYNLEVSSPGLDFRLRKPGHFRHFRGRQVIVWTRTPMEGKTHFQGILRDFTEEGIATVAVGEKTVDIPYENIGKARLDE